MTTTVSPPANFINLPVEIQLKIIRQLFQSGAPIVPLITSCKTLHNRFGYLIYRLHVYDFTITPQTLRDRSVRTLTLEDDKLKDLTVLRVKIDRIPRTSYQVHYLSFIGSKKKPYSFQSLVVLTLSTDSTHVLFDLLKVLPPGLQHLFITYTGKALFAPVHPRDLYNPKPSYISRKLTCFRFSSRHSLTKRVLHPLIAPYEITGPFEENVARAERSQKVHLWERSIALFRQRRDQAEKSFATLLFDILHDSKETLQEVKFANFDVGMVFDVESGNVPFMMSSLKAFIFDGVSQNGANHWLQLLQDANRDKSHHKGNHIPLLILNDKLGKVLYYKRICEVYSYEPGGPSLISTWHKAAPSLLNTLRRTVGLA